MSLYIASLMLQGMRKQEAVTVGEREPIFQLQCMIQVSLDYILLRGLAEAVASAVGLKLLAVASTLTLDHNV